ncbi:MULTISPECIES: DUF2635 domain-containing protein [unclassified Vibrio]|uniref:DUF2635 domain-containing protein n=1 Tax=unclassified Vibrio TaxID=2614977 RepID=UPI0004DD7DE6|nr:DUF2635 domain-containing protein [Vibrio sp. ER1A]KFA96250.1 hypothetical protein HW45_20020 [Vibrio sp. ER1A]
MSLGKKLIFLKPKKTQVPVRKPEGGFLAEGGEDVERSAYWLRRIKDGDVLQPSDEEVEAIKKARADEKAKQLEQQKKAAKAKPQTDKGE